MDISNMEEPLLQEVYIKKRTIHTTITIIAIIACAKKTLTNMKEQTTAKLLHQAIAICLTGFLST